MIRRFVDYLKRRRRQKQRELFVMFDGERTRRYDPLQVHIDFQLHPDFNWDDGELVKAGDPEATLAYASAARDIFGLSTLDPETGRGMTIAELLDVIVDFLDFCDGVKKNISDGLTSPPPMGQTFSPAAKEVQPGTTSS